MSKSYHTKRGETEEEQRKTEEKQRKNGKVELIRNFASVRPEKSPQWHAPSTTSCRSAKLIAEEEPSV
jgi:hypothetical protein